MQLAFWLLLLPGATSQHASPCRADYEQCVSSKDASPCHANDEQCALAEAAELSVSLFQSSIRIVPADHSGTDTGKVSVAQLLSGQKLQDELRLAKQARSNAFRSLEQMDERIQALEARLSTSEHDAGLQTPPTLTDPFLYEFTGGPMFTLSAAALGVVGFMFWTVRVHESSRFILKEGSPLETAPAWYLDPKIMAKVLGAGGLLWLISGMIMFTEFMWFTDDNRHLTMIESLYVTAQIVTTVGYGDMTPNSSPGKVFMAFYALTGVALIGTLVQQLVSDVEEEVEELEEGAEAEVKSPLLGQYHEVIMSVMPLVACLLFGTVFFSQYPGEDKTPFDAFYMSMITLLTIGFGAYHPVTQVGKLVGALYMLIGVVVMGSAIVSATGYWSKVQARIQSQARSAKLFREIDVVGSGTIDRMEFLNFELVRQGVKNKTADQILSQFAKLDAENTGTLDLKEFESYIKTL